MFSSIRRMTGRSRRDVPAQPKYDPIYGLPQKAVDQWLEWNPQLKAEYQRLVREAARDRGHLPLQTGDEEFEASSNGNGQLEATEAESTNVRVPERPAPVRRSYAMARIDEQ